MRQSANIYVGAVSVAFIALLASYFIFSNGSAAVKSHHSSTMPRNDTDLSPLCKSLATALPTICFAPSHEGYQQSKESYWSLNARENTPACILKPTNAQQISTAIKILKAAHDEAPSDVEFAVRSGGHSPEAGFANINDGILIDLSSINSVQVSEDKAKTTIGVGARWRDVSTKLDAMGLAIVGGRNGNVGVGGLVLGGGISFFSPRYGMVCDNVDEYEIVLSDGRVENVNAQSHEDLWKALKGGTGNFGIVTRVTLQTFVQGKIWAGYGYWASWQAPKVLAAFYELNQPQNFDEYAAGPILALGYVQKIGIRAVASSLAYTKPEKWPAPFKGFKSIWRLWSTTKVQSITAATQELDDLAQSGQRQFQVTTTVKNDLATFLEFDKIYTKHLARVKSVKGGVWSLVFQPLSATVARKGTPNVLGLETRQDTLIIVLVSVAWQDGKDDELVHRVSRDIIAECKESAQRKGTSDPYVYLNYAASGQDVLDGYGEANKKFLLDVSAKYDPNGFFQKAKKGGFQLS